MINTKTPGDIFMKRLAFLTLALTAATLAARDEVPFKDNTPPPGYRALFNGKDLAGWQGMIAVNKRAKLSEADRAKEQKAANDKILPHWKVEDGVIVYDGKGNNLQTAEDFGDIDFLCDWKIGAGGDSGIYLRGNPQVQIWDPAKWKNVGSGALFNNAKNPKDPLVNADNPIGEWNKFHITMAGDKVTVKLNGKVVVDNTVLENYWDRKSPLPERGPIELQHHGDKLWFKNIYVKEKK